MNNIIFNNIITGPKRMFWITQIFVYNIRNIYLKLFYKPITDAKLKRLWEAGRIKYEAEEKAGIVHELKKPKGFKGVKIVYRKVDKDGNIISEQWDFL